MSNPALIMLAEITCSDGSAFRIEDNIGEAIHLHFHNMRFDFTIRQFLEFANCIEQSIDHLIDVENFTIKDYDASFLFSLGTALLDLEKVDSENVKLSDLKIFTNKRFGPSPGPLTDSIMFQALKGNTKDYEVFQQENAFEEENLDRLESVFDYIKTKGYPHKKFIVLFNDQKFIRDGQHRASALLKLHGDHSIPVKRLVFKGGKHQVTHNKFKIFILYFIRKPVKKLWKFSFRAARGLYRRLKLFLNS